MSELQEYQPLFLKYRPQSLGELVGQVSVKETLKNAIQNNKLVHAYLFTGPRGTGKTSSARIFAKSLNCQNGGPTIEPCGTCASCTSIANASSLDVIEIDAASHGHVEDARLLIEKVNLASISGSYKIYIIDEVHMLSNAAFNALLKIFEEPPEKVVFVLATTEEDKVLPTIVSRCQKFNFKQISLNDSIQRLRYVATEESINVTDDALELIAKRSEGGMRDALGLLDQLSVFGKEINQETVLEFLGGLSQGDLEALSAGLSERNAQSTLEVLERVIGAGKEANAICKELNNYLLELLETAKHNFENAELVQIIDALSELEFKMKQSTQAKNLLKASLLKLCHRQDILVMKDLLTRLEALESGAAPTRSSAPTASRQAMPSSLPPTKNTSVKPASTEASPAKVSNAAVNLEQNQNKFSKPEQNQAIASPAAASSSASGDDFLEFLSPACKGIYVSSKANFVEVNENTAVLELPAKFKFLKSKLEAKSDELLSAINKASGKSATSLVINEYEGEAVEASPAKKPVEAKPKNIEPKLPKTEVKIAEPKITNTESPKLEATSSPITVEPAGAKASNHPEISAEEKLLMPSHSTGNPKLDETVKMAVQTFSGKFLD